MVVNGKQNISMIYTFKGKWIAGFVLVCIVLVFWVRHTSIQQDLVSESNIYEKAKTIPSFSNALVGFDRISSVCYNNKKPASVEDLSKFTTVLRMKKNIRLCQEQYKLFKSMYSIRTKQTTVSLSETFLPKVKRWMNGSEELVEATKKQTIIFVDNKWSLESVVFNPVRAKRPGGQGVGSVAEYVKNLVAKAKQTCDFCSYKKYTATDDFGLMESKRSVAISNTFKIEKYHGMVLFKEHSPIDFKLDQFIDAMDLAMAWFKKTNSLVPDHQYRHMYWDILPKASASQVHPHIHLALGDYSYYAKWNRLHKAGLKFSESVPSWNYWSALLQIHNAFGLSAQ